MITNRAELIEARRAALEDRFSGSTSVIEHELDEFGKSLNWLSEQGFALVPLEPDTTTIEIASEANKAKDQNGERWPPTAYWLAKVIIKAAIKAGDVLRREEYCPIPPHWLSEKEKP